LNPRVKFGFPVEISGGGSDFRKIDHPRIVDNRYTAAGKRPVKLMPGEVIK
jgi:hypothetical protein